MSTGNIERESIQTSRVEQYGGDIALESGRFARDLLARIDLKNPEAPKFRDMQNQKISAVVIDPIKDILRAGSIHFREGFGWMQRFADSDLKLMFFEYPRLLRNEKVYVGGVQFEKFELYMNLNLNPTGISVMRYVYDELRRTGRFHKQPDKMIGSLSGVEIFEEAATTRINYCLDEINRVKNKPQ